MNDSTIKTCCRFLLVASLAGCSSTSEPVHKAEIFDVTLVARAPADERFGLCLLRVDRDGTAYIKSPYSKQIYRVRPKTDHDEVPPLILDQTDPRAQTAKLSTTMD